MLQLAKTMKGIVGSIKNYRYENKFLILKNF
jgi:hypothetical protein